ncbi:MAG: GAF domain-containing protein [Nitrospira sp.]|nr:GAF domain-containing protein [Nitrospira sp.]
MSRPKWCEEEQVGRVLIVESERETLRRLLDRLAAEGIEAVGVSSAAEALAIVERERPGIVVMTLHLPDQDQEVTAFLRKIRTGHGDRCIIVHGGHASFEEAKGAIGEGIFAYVERHDGSKKADEELIRHIHRARETVLARYAHSLESVVVRRTAQLRDRLEKLTDLHEVVIRLHAGADRQDVCAVAMDAVSRISGLDRCALLLFETDGVMRFQAWRGLSAAYRQGVEGHGPWTPQTVHAVPLLVSDAQAEPTLAAYRELFQQEGIGALAFIPLARPGGNRILGKLMLYAPAPLTWQEEDIQLVQLIADHVVAALLRIEAEESLRRSYRQREQICLDLHDGILQSLYAVGLLLQVMKRDADTVAPSLSPSLERVVDQLNGIIKDVRWFIEQVVRGEELSKVVPDLAQALDQLIGTMDPVGVHGIERRFAQAGPIVLPAERITHILSIVKEAISNSLRHSQAMRRWVALQRRRSGVRLEVGDDGIGLDRHLKRRGGMGLFSMAARAEQIGVRLTVRSRPGRGTKIILELPCADEAKPPLSHEQPVMSVMESRAGGGAPLLENTPRYSSRTSFSRLAHSGR